MAKITPHEPQEVLLSGEDALRDADESERRWENWERGRALKELTVQLPVRDHEILAQLAERQGIAPTELCEALLHGVLSAFAGPAARA